MKKVIIINASPRKTWNLFAQINKPQFPKDLEKALEIGKNIV